MAKTNIDSYTSSSPGNLHCTLNLHKQLITSFFFFFSFTGRPWPKTKFKEQLRHKVCAFLFPPNHVSLYVSDLKIRK